MNTNNKTNITSDDFTRKNRHKASELLFVAFLAITAIAALIAMLSYSFIAARPPLVITIPLLILILVHGFKLYLKPPSIAFFKELEILFLGGERGSYQVIAIFAWMVVFLLFVVIFGHYPGMFVFIFVLMKFISGEATKLSLSVSLGATGFIYLIFTFVLGIGLYDGVIYMFYQGYQIF